MPSVSWTLSCSAQDKPEAAHKLSERAARILELQTKKRIGLKSANEYIRSSKAQQEERRQRLRTQAQKHARNLAATQKSGKGTSSRSQNNKRKATAPQKAKPETGPFENIEAESGAV